MTSNKTVNFILTLLGAYGIIYSVYFILMELYFWSGVISFMRIVLFLFSFLFGLVLITVQFAFTDNHHV